MAVASELHIKGLILGASGIVVYVVADFLKSDFIPWVIGDLSKKSGEI